MKNALDERSRRSFKASEIAGYLGVTSHAVIKWIKSGKLRSYATPGGHHRVRPEELRAFLERHDIPVDEGFLRRGLAPRTVLVVSEERATAASVEDLLIALDPGLRVEHAADVYEAGIAIGALVPEMIVLDLAVPGADGIAFCRSVRSQTVARRIKIVVLVGVAEYRLVQRLFAAGVNLCLAKPFDGLEFQHCVAELLRSDPPAEVRRADRKGA